MHACFQELQQMCADLVAAMEAIPAGGSAQKRERKLAGPVEEAVHILKKAGACTHLHPSLPAHPPARLGLSRAPADAGGERVGMVRWRHPLQAYLLLNTDQVPGKSRQVPGNAPLSTFQLSMTITRKVACSLQGMLPLRVRVAGCKQGCSLIISAARPDSLRLARDWQG